MKIVLGVLMMLPIILIVALIKNEITYRNLMKIMDAIFAYQNDCIDKNDFNYKVNYSDMKGYDEVCDNWFDWGYKNILPPDKFEIIKPFIDKL